MMQRKIMVAVDDELARRLEARRRATPIERPVPSLAKVVRDLLERGLACDGQDAAATPAPVPRVVA